MSRGRRQNWICKDCKSEFSVQGSKPKMCCACGSDNIGRAPSYELLLAYEEAQEAAETTAERLNRIYEQYIEEKEKFDKVIAYWKTQYQRGYITKEEYQEKQRLFIGANIRRSK